MKLRRQRYPLLKPLGTAIKYLLIYLSMLSIRSRKIYVFGAWAGNRFSDNPKYLFLEAVKDKNLTAIWITKSEEVYKQLKAKGYKVYLHNSIKGVYCQLRASIYFTCFGRNDVNALFMGNATRINLWHGLPLKKIMDDDKISNIKYASRLNFLMSQIRFAINYLPYRRKEYVVSTSDKISLIYKSAFRKKTDKILQLGQPRNDLFFDRLEADDLIIKEVDKKVVLYMPTHRNAGKKVLQLNQIFDLDALNKFCKENGVLFVIRKHYYHKSEKVLKGYSNVVDITAKEYDSQQLLNEADVLITDYSSCYIDYLLLDRPIIFYNFDIKEYIVNDREFYFNYHEVTPGVKVMDFNQLSMALKEIIIDGIDVHHKIREDVKNIFYSADNQKKVSRKILDVLKERRL